MKAPSHERDVYVVYDVGGAGRVLGVFEDPARAARVVAVNPPYFKMTRVALEQITPGELDWIDPRMRPALEEAAR